MTMINASPIELNIAEAIYVLVSLHPSVATDKLTLTEFHKSKIKKGIK